MRIKESSKKTLYLILGLLLLSICSLTIVYAALSAVLRISGSSEVVASNWNIYLANPEVKSGSVSSTVPTISGNNLSFSANLTIPGDYYEFTVDVVNEGTIDAMIDSVVKTPELTAAQAKYIKYEISYENGESITTNQTIKSGTSTPIKVRIEYRTDISSSDLPSSTNMLDLKLSLIYVQSDGTGSEIPDNGVKLVKVISGDGVTKGNEICIKEECFYVISSTDTMITMLSKYNLHVGNTYDSDNGVAALANPTGIQDKTAKGVVDGVSTLIGTTAFSTASQKGTNYSDYSGSVVEDYVNSYKSYLMTQGVIPIDARLITKDELITLGCNESNSSCSEAPSWVYTTSYWSGSANSVNYVWYIRSNKYFGYGVYFHDISFGVRPVITISRDYL